MSTYEIEIKTLLGSKEKAELLKTKIVSKGGKLSSINNQLNHYFTLTDPIKLKEKLWEEIPPNKRAQFEVVLNEGLNLSVRTRDTDGAVSLVIKASMGKDTSANGVSRMEFECPMDKNINDLDAILLNAGLEQQAKWSREREEYILGNIHICIDRNAGYGYVAELEEVSDDFCKNEIIKNGLYELMGEFGLEELSQDRLERMFKYYNENWRDYYGTEKVFNIE